MSCVHDIIYHIHEEKKSVIKYDRKMEIDFSYINHHLLPFQFHVIVLL